MSLSRQLARWVALILLLPAVMATSVSGMVLCIGDNGHLAVEMEHHDHCGQHGEPSGHAHDAAVFLAADAASCDGEGCIDVPLRYDEMPHAGKSLKNKVAVKISLVSELEHVFKELVHQDTNEVRHSPRCTNIVFNQSLLEKGTIVLRV